MLCWAAAPWCALVRGRVGGAGKQVGERCQGCTHVAKLERVAEWAAHRCNMWPYPPPAAAALCSL